MANNTVNITNSNNTVTITPQDNNTLNTETTTTSVSVTQGSTSVVTVNTPGPRGATGIQGEGATIDTGSFITTSSFTTYTGSVDSTFAGTSSFATTASFAITSSYISGDNVDGSVSSATTATTATSATTATTATNANNVYIDFGTTDTIMRIPMATGTSDGYHQLKSPISEILYYRGYGNPITGQSNSNDYLHIGGGSNTAGGIFLNSTISLNNFIYSDFGTLYIQADDQFGSNNESYPAALEMTTYTGSAAATSGSNYIKLLSTDIILENGVSGSTQITGSIDVSGSITASNSIQIGPNTAALFGRSDRSSLAVGRTPYLYAGNNAFQADLFYTYNQGSANVPALYIGTNGGGAGRGIYASGHGLRFSANNSTTFYFDGAANTGTYGPSIGIGIDPVANLDIKTLRTPYDYFRISGSSGFSVETDLSASAETFMISKSGDVGIGTWSPTHKLTVVGSVSASAFIGDGSTLDNVVGLPHTGSLITSGGIVTLNTADYAFRDSSQVPAHRVKTREGIYVGSNGDSASAFGMYYGYNQIKYNNGYGRPTLSFSSHGINLNGSFAGDTVRGTNGLTVGGGNGKEIGVTGGSDLNVTFTGQFGAALTSGQSYIQLHGPNHNPNKGKLIIAAGNNSQHGHIQFYTTGSERMRITHSGSIGIGVTDPQTNLHVSGTVSASSFSGDGSGLTGVSVFPFTGSADISGSLIVRDADTTLRGNVNVKGEDTDASIINVGGNVNSGGTNKIIFKHHSHPTNEAAGILSSGTSYGRSTGLIFYVKNALSDAGTLLSTDKILTLQAGSATFHKNTNFNNLELSYSNDNGGRLGMPIDMPSPTRSTLTLEGGQATYQNRGGGSLILKAGGGSGTGDSGIISFYTITGSLASGEENIVVERGRFTPNGEFGIGTTTPSEKLTVEGNISASAYLGSVTDITPPNTTTTASLDCSLSNFFTLTLSSSNNIHLTSSNITAGQSINLRIIQPATSGSLTYDDTFKFPNGAPYEVSATHSVEDIVSFISFDSGTLYGSSLKNFE